MIGNPNNSRREQLAIAQRDAELRDIDIACEVANRCYHNELDAAHEAAMQREELS